jgi:hypothetical protein
MFGFKQVHLMLENNEVAVEQHNVDSVHDPLDGLLGLLHNNHRQSEVGNFF